MSPSSTEPEFIVQESEKTHLTESLQDCTNQIYKVQVQAKLRQLYEALSLSIELLEKTRDSVRELEQLREDLV